MNLHRTLGRVPAPDEAAATQRAWSVVQSAYQAQPLGRPPRSRRRLVLAPMVAVALAAVALSPAGATVGQVIDRALGVPHAARALFSLPAPGTLLASGPSGTWTVAANGAKRRLGAWDQASWSPHGLFVIVAGQDELAALDPQGTPRWALARPQVADPRWFPSNGYRVAYLSGHSLRVVAGDGTGDHLVAAAVAPVAPAWRPDHLYQLAYVTPSGQVIVRDGDSALRIWDAAPAAVQELSWSADGSELLVVGASWARVYGPGGVTRASVRMPAGVTISDAALSPDGRSLAIVRGGAGEDVLVQAVGVPGAGARRVLSGQGLRQIAWSPDGRWLLITWPAADQWVFVRAAGGPGIDGVSRIAEQFAAGGRPTLPHIDGWCCTARGIAG